MSRIGGGKKEEKFLKQKQQSKISCTLAAVSLFIILRTCSSKIEIVNDGITSAYVE